MDAPSKGLNEVAKPVGTPGLQPEARSTAARLINDERVRFILVGTFNTGFGFLLFVAFEFLVTGRWSYFVSLCGSYLVATISAFVLHRHFTYRMTGTGTIVLDFVRFQGVYAVALGVNAVALPLLVEVAHMPPIGAQAIVVSATTLISYFGHKLFSFRRPRSPVSSA